MPRVKYADLLKRLEECDAFHVSVVKALVGDYAKVMVHKLHKKGKIVRLMKGWYTFKKTPYVLWIPLMGYVGLGHAASYWGLWNQACAITILTPRKVREGERFVGGEKVIVKRVKPYMLFGFAVVEMEGVKVRMSDKEKTLIDLAYFGHPCLDEVAEVARELADKEKVKEYVEELRKRGAYRWRIVRRKLERLLGGA